MSQMARHGIRKTEPTEAKKFMEILLNTTITGDGVFQKGVVWLSS